MSKKLGIWGSASLVAGNIIGSGIFMLPASLASIGGLGLAGWLISAMGSLAIAFVFSWLGRLYPGQSGGPYIFARKGMGDLVAFLVAWGYWISVWCAVAAIAVAFMSYLAVFIPILSQNQTLAMFIGIAVVWLLTWINSLGIQKASWLQIVSTVMKIIPLFLIGCWGLFFIELDNFFPLNLTGKSDIYAIGSAISLTMFAFLGMESATIPADEVENPEKVVPRATILGMSVSTLVYLLCSVAIMGMIPMEQLQDSTAPFADAGERMWGSWARYFVAGAALISTFGALNGWILIQGHLPKAVALDGLFPKVFGRSNEQGTPLAGLVIGSILVTILMYMNYTEGLVGAFEFMILLSTLSCLVPYFFAALSYLLIRNKEGIRSPITLFIALIALLFSFGAMLGSGREAIFWGLLLLVLGIPVYLWVKAKNS